MIIYYMNVKAWLFPTKYYISCLLSFVNYQLSIISVISWVYTVRFSAEFAESRDNLSV